MVYGVWSIGRNRLKLAVREHLMNSETFNIQIDSDIDRLSLSLAACVPVLRQLDGPGVVLRERARDSCDRGVWIQSREA